MNKRLLLSLYDRSGLGAYMPVDLKGHELEVEEHMEKFAELIVRECIKVIEINHPEFDCKESADNLIRRAGRMDAIDEINNYFEVEE